jgi:hypothetical protein
LETGVQDLGPGWIALNGWVEDWKVHGLIALGGIASCTDKIWLGYTVYPDLLEV